MKKHIIKEEKILQKAFKKELLFCINKLKVNNRIVIWLSGWNSLNIFYSIFEEIFINIEKDIRNKIFFCLLDERLIPFDNDDSNTKKIKNDFLDNLIIKDLIKKENILLPNLKSKYVWKNYFNKVKKIDIWLFGVWEDWHIASLFPNHILLNNNKKTYLEINNSPKPPLNRITISKKVIKDIDYSFVFFMWENKKEALKWFLSKKSFTEFPVKLLLESSNIILISNILW